MAHPLTPKESVNAEYTNNSIRGSYIGMKDSAIFCNNPMDDVSFYYDEVQNSGYTCPLVKLPFEESGDENSYPNWDDKWYSPICRPWFEDAEKNFDYGGLYGPYEDAGGTAFEVITPCMPILNQSQSADKPSFFGTLCIDRNIVYD